MEDQCSHALVTSELTGNMFLSLSPAWGGCCTLKMYWECRASATKQLLPMLDAPSATCLAQLSPFHLFLHFINSAAPGMISLGCPPCLALNKMG